MALYMDLLLYLHTLRFARRRPGQKDASHRQHAQGAELHVRVPRTIPQLARTPRLEDRSSHECPDTAALLGVTAAYAAGDHRQPPFGLRTVLLCTAAHITQAELASTTLSKRSVTTATDCAS